MNFDFILEKFPLDNGYTRVENFILNKKTQERFYLPNNFQFTHYCFDETEEYFAIAELDTDEIYGGASYVRLFSLLDFKELDLEYISLGTLNNLHFEDHTLVANHSFIWDLKTLQLIR